MLIQLLVLSLTMTTNMIVSLFHVRQHKSETSGQGETSQSKLSLRLLINKTYGVLGLCKGESGIPHAFLVLEYLDDEGKCSTVLIDFGQEGVMDILIGGGLLRVAPNQEEMRMHWKMSNVAIRAIGSRNCP